MQTTNRLIMVLLRMVATGRCRVEDFDSPSPWWELQQKAAKRLQIEFNVRLRPHENSVRAWIEANEIEWKQIWELHREEREARLKAWGLSR